MRVQKASTISSKNYLILLPILLLSKKNFDCIIDTCFSFQYFSRGAVFANIACGISTKDRIRYSKEKLTETLKL